MTTAGDVVTAAFQKAGITGDGQAVDGDDLENGLNDLRDMLALWNEKRWLVWNLLDFAFLSDGRTTGGYSVGPGGNFPMTPRPSRVEACYIRQIVSAGNNVDFYLEEIPARQEYARISLKTLVSFPKFFFYDSAFPLGLLHLYPWPNASIYEIHIVVKNVFPVTLTQATSFANYPPVAIPAMKFNLARWLRQAYGKGLRPDPELNNIAADTLESVRMAQIQVPELMMPKMLIGPRRYNIYSDQLS